MLSELEDLITERIEFLLYLSLLLYAIKYGMAAPVPNELVYEMELWNDAIGIVTKSLNHSQTLLGYVGLEYFSNPPDPIGGIWVGPARRLPYTVLSVLTTPLFNGDYTEALQFSLTIGFIFTAIIAYPLTGYMIQKLTTAVSSRKSGLLALFGFAWLQIVGWPGKPLYNLKFQHTMAIPLCLLALYFATLTIQEETTSDRHRYAILTGVVLGISGLTQYHYTLITILSVFVALSIQKMWRSLARTGVTGLAFASFYVIIPQAGEKILEKAAGTFSGNGGGGSLLTVDGFASAVLTPGVLVILLVCGMYAMVYLLSRGPIVEGHLLEVSTVLTWLLWFVPKTGSMRDGEAVIALWFLEVLLLVGVVTYLWELVGDSALKLHSKYDVEGVPVVFCAWIITTLLLLGVAPFDGPSWL